MPHVWEHSLFYLESVQIDGSQPYRFQRRDTYEQQCAAGTAPRRACAGVSLPG